MLSYLPGSVGVACSLFLSVSFEGMGYEPTLNLAATPDEAVSIICTVVNKTILLTLWGKLMYVSYTTDRPVFSRASHRCSSYNLSLGFFYMVDFCLWDACQDDVAPGKLLIQCACQFFLDWAHQLMYVHDQLMIVISSSGMLAMLAVLVLDHQSFGRSCGVMMALQ